ncbi:MAG: ATP-dependent Clp protease ATP-binding subunit [archaeon]|nr:ATP-dependent Clp protease ATP-binding subunit [archaeon]
MREPISLEERIRKDIDFPKEKLPEDSILAKIGTDLTYMAAKGQLKPVYHREKDLEEVIEILGRGEAANPIIIGEAGVGKTVICHLLAQEIVKQNVPPWLLGWKIVETSFLRMWGTIEHLDSDFAEHQKNLTKVLQECNEKPIILFMDEIHTIVNFPVSRPRIMQSLADGSLRLIGVTTLREYRRYVEKDGALVRRFSPVYIHEPSPEVTIRILSEVKAELERHYEVQIKQDILELAINSADKYIHNVYQPSKSIQLMESAAIHCRREGREELTRDDVLHAISKRTGLPTEILSRKGDTLLGLEDALNQRVLGQKEIIKEVATRLFVTRTKVNLYPQRPNGVFLFAGPTGVGKTELAKALSSFLTGSEKNMVRFDMSSYSGRYSIESLLGIPSSGAGEEARVPPLTQAIKDRPYTVLLLDEIEKAHPEIWKIFLAAFDEGRLVDLQGTEMYFDHVTVVMTTNLGFGEKRAIIDIAGEEQQSSYEQLKSEFIKAIEDTFPREFLARIDEILVFKPLTQDIIKGLVNQKIKLLEERLGKKIKLSEDALDFLEKRGYSARYGARFLERTIDRYVSFKLAELKISGRWDTVDTIQLSVADSGGELVMSEPVQVLEGAATKKKVRV